MAYFFNAHIRIKNNREYQKYIDKASNVFSKYNGEYLVVDDNPLVLEGTWDYTRCILIKFETKEDFFKWYQSDEYQQILQYRFKSSRV